MSPEQFKDETKKWQAEKLEASLKYANRGWLVFPLNELEKTPRISKADGGNGVKDAALNSVQIQEWHQRFPNSNVGLAADGFWVLDVDNKPGQGGLESLAALEAEYGRLPETLSQTTPSGGKHYLFKNDPKYPIKNQSNKFRAGLDTRSQGGYIVAAPSRTESGQYKWDNDCRIAKAPEWLLKLASSNATVNSNTGEYTEGFQKAADNSMGDHSGRNNYMRDFISSRLRKLGIANKDEVWTLAEAENERVGNPGLPSAELRQTFNSQVRWHEEGRAGEDWKGKDKSDAGVSNVNFDNFDFDDLPNLEELEIPERCFLVDGFIEKGQLGQIVGDWGCGKTYLALSLANAVANGTVWCGFKAQQTPVLILDRENLPETTQRRMAKMGVKGNGKLKVFSIKSYIEGQPTSFDIEMSSKILTRYAEKHPGCLLIIDSLRGWLPQGADENKAVDIRAFMNLLRKLTAKGASIIVLHHNNKSGTISGSTDIGASADYGFSIEPTKDPVSGLLQAIALKHLKQREEMNNGLTFKFDGCKFERESPRLIRINSKHTKMIEILKEHPGVTQSRFVKLVVERIKKATKDEAKDFLIDNVDNGNIRREASGQSFNHTWAAPAKQTSFGNEGENAA